MAKDKLTFLEQPIHVNPVPAEGQIFKKNLEHFGAYNMLKELKTMFSQQAEHELLKTMRAFHVCKQEKGQSVSSYEYNGFVKNYNMHGLWKTVIELNTMLKLHEETIPNKEAAPALHAIRAGRIQKNNKNKKPLKAAKGKDQSKGKTKLFYAPKYKISPPPKKDNPAKDAICHQCGEVYDIGCATHICNTTQGLRGSKKLKLGALNLYVGNGQRAAVEAIGSFHLCLPSGLVIVLENCHYDPYITRGFLSISRLHINKKRIEKLQHNGLLKSTDDESFDKCVSCLSGKVARKPF
ncbi:hypothetical protein Tco_0604441 [Tanacetum coccineum]